MKPWYYTIGYPVKVLHYGSWRNAIICDGYRYEDGIITTMVEDGEEEWLYENQKEYCLKPNLPDNNQWIPVSERLPDEHTYQKVWITEKTPQGVNTVKGIWDHNELKHVNGMAMKFEAIAWKPYILPEPYKEADKQ